MGFMHITNKHTIQYKLYAIWFMLLQFDYSIYNVQIMYVNILILVYSKTRVALVPLDSPSRRRFSALDSPATRRGSSFSAARSTGERTAGTTSATPSDLRAHKHKHTHCRRATATRTCSTVLVCLTNTIRAEYVMRSYSIDIPK